MYQSISSLSILKREKNRNHKRCSFRFSLLSSILLRTITFIIMKFLSTLLILSMLTLSSIHAIAIDDFHCKVPTCRDFHYGLLKYPHHQEYVDLCYDTVYELQSIPSKHGKCIDGSTGKVHPPCIYALANTIKSCINGLSELPEKEAKYYCGYTLMKYCAVHLGLDQIPLSQDY